MIGGVVRMRRRVEGRIISFLLKVLTSSNEEGEYISKN